MHTLALTKAYAQTCTHSHASSTTRARTIAASANSLASSADGLIATARACHSGPHSPSKRTGHKACAHTHISVVHASTGAWVRSGSPHSFESRLRIERGLQRARVHFVARVESSLKERARTCTTRASKYACHVQSHRSQSRTAGGWHWLGVLYIVGGCVRSTECTS